MSEQDSVPTTEGPPGDPSGSHDPPTDPPRSSIMFMSASGISALLALLAFLFGCVIEHRPLLRDAGVLLLLLSLLFTFLAILALNRKPKRQMLRKSG